MLSRSTAGAAMGGLMGAVHRDEPALRSLRPDDAEEVVALYAAAMAAEPDIGPITAEGWTRTIALPQFGGGRDFLVAAEGGRLVGMAESSLRDQGHRLMRNLKIVVDPAARRRGLGTALLRAALAQEPEAGSLAVQANVWGSWTAGLAFLARFGFARIESEVYMRCRVLRPAGGAPEGVTFRRAADVGAAAARAAAIHNAAYAGDAGFCAVDATGMRASLAGARLWLAELRGEAVAHAVIESDPDVSWLESLAVEPAHQGLGIGGALATRAFVDDGVGTGGRAAGLSASSTNPRALRLYGRLGFERTREKGKYAASREDIRARLGA